MIAMVIISLFSNQFFYICEQSNFKLIELVKVRQFNVVFIQKCLNWMIQWTVSEIVNHAS